MRQLPAEAVGFIAVLTSGLLPLPKPAKRAVHEATAGSQLLNRLGCHKLEQTLLAK